MTKPRTPERLRAICDSLKEGASKEAAARSGGISASTLNRWCDEDPEIAERVAEAEAEAESFYTKRIRQEATKENGAWQAAAWWLERRRPDSFALIKDRPASGGRDVIPLQLAQQIRVYLEQGKTPEIEVGEVLDIEAPREARRRELLEAARTPDPS